MIKKFILVVFMAVFSYAQAKFSDPQPTFDNPRKVVYSLYVEDLKTVEHTIWVGEVERPVSQKIPTPNSTLSRG